MRVFSEQIHTANPHKTHTPNGWRASVDGNDSSFSCNKIKSYEPIIRFLVTVCLFAHFLLSLSVTLYGERCAQRSADDVRSTHTNTNASMYRLRAVNDAELNANKYSSFSFISFFFICSVLPFRRWPRNACMWRKRDGKVIAFGWMGRND